MAVKLRLTRMGKKKRPFYRIVAVDSRTQRDGRFLENLGYYNPMTDPPEVRVDAERALHWLQQGAIPTDTVRSLFKREGIMFRFHLIRSGLSEEKMQEELKKWEVLQLEKQKRLEAKRAQAEREKQQQAAQETAEEKAEEAQEAAAEETAAESSEVEAETTAESEG